MNSCDEPAGVFIRFFALLIDGILLGIVMFIIFPNNVEPTIYTNQIFQLLYTIILSVVWSGYTVGKRLMGIRIVKIEGEDVGLGTMLIREFLCSILYAITFGILIICSIFMVAFREDKRSIHDIIAGTYVTYKKPGEVYE